MKVLGIDPQDSLLSLCVLDDNVKILYWDNNTLQRQIKFKNAQSYQEYLLKECMAVVNDLHKKYKLDLVVIEQQRGRVRSILEHSLLSVCMQLCIARVIFHPATWKKRVGFSKEKKGHKFNKEESIRMGLPFLNAYQGGILKKKFPKRLHDLTDSYHLAKAGSSYILNV